MNDLKILQKYHAILKPYLAIFLVSISFDIAVTILGLATPLFTRVLFDYAYAFRNLDLLNVTIAAIVVTYFVYFFLNVASDYLQIYVNQDCAASLTQKVFHTIARLPMRFHQEKRCGDLLIRITGDVTNTIGMVTNVLPTLIIDGGRFVIILAIALYINPKLTLMALASIPLYMIEAKFFAGRLADVERNSIDTDSSIFSRIEEKLANIKTVKAFGQEKAEALSFGILLKRRYRIMVKGRVLDVLRTFANSITLQLWMVLLMWYLGLQVVRGELTVGEIVALMLYLEQLGEPVRSFIALFTDWKRSMVSMKRIDEVLDGCPEDSREDLTEHLELTEGDIRAEHISFEYLPNEEIIHGVDVHFPPRSVTAIVGASGSGKSTIVNLLLRFFDPTAGIILVDGQDISEIKVHELRNRVGIVTQDAALFEGTIIENILYGNEAKSRGDAMQAARVAGASNFIEKLPGGYDTQVGPGGSTLSSGQRQRIAIARTLLRNPAIIVLDEATSALDAESEFHIQEAIHHLRQSKTLIVIAHRLSTIKTADDILVMEDGRFVESGDFDSLVAKKGAFYRYYWKQFGGLASLRQQLQLELERSARYGSKFCLVVLKILSFDAIAESEDSHTANKFIDEVDLHIKRHIRMGDNCAVLDGDTILMLLPEIDEAQLGQFFERMMKVLPSDASESLSHSLDAEDLRFVGTRITKKLFRTPEELLSALKQRADGNEKSGSEIIDEDDLELKASRPL